VLATCCRDDHLGVESESNCANVWRSREVSSPVSDPEFVEASASTLPIAILKTRYALQTFEGRARLS